MNYEYDPFQKKAIQAIDEGHSVLVSAPTGAGKTAIAEYVIERALERNERVVYTAPIKTISNQKYRDFMTSYPDRIGILTGDVSINPDAPVTIMTTEIYRNRLFEGSSDRHPASWVIFDEVHYLDDRERGTVWEEAFMFAHPGTRFVCLSATAPNIDELARWIESLHPHPIVVVREDRRPVDLVHHFQCQNIIYTDLNLLKKEGFLGFDTWSSRNRRHPRHRGRPGWHEELRAKPNSTYGLLKHLIAEDRLPCLYFAFGRRRVEELAREHTQLNLLTAEEREENTRLFAGLSSKYGLDNEKSAAEMAHLVARGIAFHHAGMLPTLKEVVEQLFTAKRIRLIFTTETFALGINMPARTVVFDELRKFYGFGFDHLTTRDYYQMAGRAGRRGIDTVGYVYSRVNPQHIAHSAVTRIVTGQTEPIRSQFNASYATLLNLYRHFGKRLFDVYPKSFHAFQSGEKGQRKGLANLERKFALLKRLGYVGEKGPTAKGEFASCLYGYELVLSELLESSFLERLNPTELCVLLTSLVYEPRRNEFSKRLPSHFHYLEREAKKAHHRVQHAEKIEGIFPHTRPPHFHLTAAVEAWVAQTPFDKLARYTDVDEGIIIRYFRMVIQLLRQIGGGAGVDERLRTLCHKALPLVNRDIVDAEKLLRST